MGFNCCSHDVFHLINWVFFESIITACFIVIHYAPFQESPYRPEFFSGLIFTTAQVVHITTRITFVHVFIRSSNIWLSYILNRLFITSRVYLKPTSWPAPSWLVSSVGRALHRYRRGHGFKSRTGLNFFSGLIFTTAQVVHITARITFIHIPFLVLAK